MASANVFEMVHGEKLEKLHHALKTDHSASFLFLIGEIMALMDPTLGAGAEASGQAPPQKFLEVLHMLKHHPDVKIAAPLHSAAESDAVQTVNEILRLGYNIDEVREGDGMTALAVAAQRSSLKTFTRLLEGKAQTDLKDNVGRLPIHHAASSGVQEAVSMLLSAGTSVDAVTMEHLTPLHCACEHGQLEVARLLLQRGASINAKSLKGYAPLHYAVEGGHCEIVDYLIDQGCKVEITDKQHNIADVASDAYAKVPYAVAKAQLSPSRRTSVEYAQPP